MIVATYNKAAKMYTYLNKVLYFVFLLFVIYIVKIDTVKIGFELNYLIPIALSTLLFLIYDTNKGFAQHSLRNKFFPTLVAFIVLITQFISIDVVNYILILSASYDLLITTERRDLSTHKKYIGPIFILGTQLIGLLFDFGINNDLVFISYWIVVSRLFPFSILKNANSTIDEHYLTRTILILNFAFGNIIFSPASIIFLLGAIILSIGFMYFMESESQTVITYRSILLSSIILFCIVSGVTSKVFLVTSLLWIDFYFLALIFTRINSSLPELISRKIGNAIFFLLLTGIFIGAANFVISENLKILFLNGQIVIGSLLLLPILVSATLFFARNNYKLYIYERIRKIDHFDTFMAQLIIIIGVILSV